MSDSDQVGLEGFAPVVTHGTGNPEAQKYGRLWEMKQYRAVAPGEQLAQVFLAQARPRKGAHVVDFGCGTGRGALQLVLVGGLIVTMVDFVKNCLDLDIKNMLAQQPERLQFVKADLERGPLPVAEYGYCTDVMEHIPPDKVEVVLNNILAAAQHVFFSISTVEDQCGKLIGEPLHLSIHPYAWWLEEFKRRDCVIHWSQDADGCCLFYVSAWMTGRRLVEEQFPINTEEETVRRQVKQNIEAGWLQVMPQETNDVDLAILGGGPSLSDHVDEIKRLRAEGVKIITLNGAYNWALAQGITPHATVIVDARAFNARFVDPVVDDCRYLLSSQCHPDVFAHLPKDRTFLWHSDTDLIKDLLDAHYEHWWTVPGGSTVLFRSIPLLRMLGYRRFHLFGCDSCLAEQWMIEANGQVYDAVFPSQREAQAAIDDAPDLRYVGFRPVPVQKHHAYVQPENDGAVVVPVVVNAEGQFGPLADAGESGRVFYCHPWMATQAQEMIELIGFLGDEVELEIHGDGLLAHILRVGAHVSGVSVVD